MSGNSTIEALSASILALRVERGLTQAALAEQLGITFQAVSKWETGQSAPDIALLPQLAEIFGVQIDELFGREAAVAAVVEEKQEYYVVKSVPWDDDGELRGVVYKGRKLLRHAPLTTKQFTFVYSGEALNVSAWCSLDCGNVMGGAKAGTSITASNIGGDASAGTSVSAQGIGGAVRAGTHVTAHDVTGNISAGTSVTANDITGSVFAGTRVTGKRIFEK